MRLVLEYKRDIKDGGVCTGQIVRREEGQTDDVRSSFLRVQFQDMLLDYAKHCRLHPEDDCKFRRIDKGDDFPESDWLPQHIAQFRSDRSDELVHALSNPAPYGVPLKEKQDA